MLLNIARFEAKAQCVMIEKGLQVNRQERRRASKGKSKTPVVRSREIFTTPNLCDKEVHLDVWRMRVWAEKNIVPQKFPIDADHVKRLVDGGTVTGEWISGYTVNQIPKRILVCEHSKGLGDEIVDGNHTYVATAISWAHAVKQGMVPSSMTLFVEGFGLTPAQWRPFAVPHS